MALRVGLAKVCGMRILAERGELYDEHGRNISYDWLNPRFIPSLPQLLQDARAYIDNRKRVERVNYLRRKRYSEERK